MRHRLPFFLKPVERLFTFCQWIMIESLKKEQSEQLFSGLGVGMHTCGPGTREN